MTKGFRWIQEKKCHQDVKHERIHVRRNAECIAVQEAQHGDRPEDAKNRCHLDYVLLKCAYVKDGFVGRARR